MEKAALVLEGGGLRSMFTAAVVDRLIEDNIEFEYVNGVSAGALCGVTYLAKQAGRVRDINLTYIKNRRYMSLTNLLATGNVFNFDFLFSGKTQEKYPINYDKFRESKQLMEATVTNCFTGRPNYYKNSDPDILTAVKASASMPFFSQPIYINSIPYLDGGIADAIPYKRAQQLGYKKLVVVLTRDKNYVAKKRRSLSKRFVRTYYKDYPKLVKQLLNNSEHFNKEFRALENDKNILVIQPDKEVKVGGTDNNVSKLRELYDQGSRVMNESMFKLQNYLKN